jgi:anaerobic selenocysteine-containing dehydrogenase
MTTPFRKTACVLCAQNCGLEVQVENNTIVKVRPDKDNPRSRGYACRKGMNIANHQHHADRLTRPLKKTPDGFVPISWDQAYAEIGERLKAIVDEHGPKSMAYMGGGGQGCHFEAAFGMTMLKGLGSRYNYNALAQELTGYFWACGRMTGRQNRFWIPDEEHADMILGIGWNGMASHQMPRAPLVLKEFSSNPDKMLAIIDPRLSETAKVANIHLPLRPGTDALLARAMIAVILQEGLENKAFIAEHVTGFEMIRPWFDSVDVPQALAVCEVDETAVRDLCRLLAVRKWCMHFDLGVYMNRHSTLASYLYMILATVCGRACVPGGNVIPGGLVPLGSHTDERDPKVWRTVTTGFPALNGAFPPNVLPEEVLSDHPERLRALIISSSNPLRSYADTTAYEEAFKKLDLVVTIELAMTETAELSDYVLPSRSGYESFDGTFFPWTYPEVFFQMRHPVVEADGEKREAGEILTGIADAAGLIPPIPDHLKKAARKGLQPFAAALFSYAARSKKAQKVLPMVLSRTLGQAMASGNKAALFGLMLGATKQVTDNAARVGMGLPPLWKTVLNPVRIWNALSGMIRYRSVAPVALLTPKVAWAEFMYQTIIDHPQGLWIGKADFENNMKEIRTDDGKIHIHIPDMDDWMGEITPEAEHRALTPDPAFPLVLCAGRHTPNNANTLMRKPDWNKGRRACTLAMHPDDAGAQGLADGETVRITTEAASETIELEITGEARKGQVMLPHGFGLKYQGEMFGVNVNRLTSSTHRDRFAATPLHRFVPCRVEKV